MIIFQNIPYFYFLQSYLSNNQNATERTHHILSKVFLQRYQTLKPLLLVTICDSIKCKQYVANFSNFGQNQIIEHLLNQKLELHSFRDSQDIQSYSIFVFGNYL